MKPREQMSRNRVEKSDEYGVWKIPILNEHLKEVELTKRLRRSPQSNKLNTRSQRYPKVTLAS